MEKKRLLIFAHYYYPDVASTGQLLQELAEGMTDTFDVTVICVVPSYTGAVPPEYTTQKYYVEQRNEVRMLRVRVPEFQKSDKASRIKNILAYFIRAMGAARRAGPQDYVFTISQPPVLGGLLGVIGKWMKHARMIYCIQDFNPEQIMAVGYSKNALMLRLMMQIDKFSCRRSNLVVTVGRDLARTLENRFSGKRVPPYVIINNWIDEKSVYPLPSDHEKVQAFKKKYGLNGKLVFGYSGNMGLYYDLEKLIEVMKQFRKGYTSTGVREEGARTPPSVFNPSGREVVFAFIGAGSVKDKLVNYAKKHHFENLVFIPYQDKEELNYSLNAIDIHWCVNAQGIKGVSVPSNVYLKLSVAA